MTIKKSDVLAAFKNTKDDKEMAAQLGISVLQVKNARKAFNLNRRCLNVEFVDDTVVETAAPTIEYSTTPEPNNWL